MPLFDTYNRIPNTSVPRMLEIGPNIIINGQVFDGATLSRKSSKLFEVYGDRDTLRGSVSSFNQVNLTTAMLGFGDKSGDTSNIYAKSWIIDSTNANIAYYVSGLASATALIYKIDLTTFTILSSLTFGTPAQAGGFVFVGQDATTLYGIGGNLFLHKIPKVMSAITSTAWTTAGTTQKSNRLLFADAVNGVFVWHDTINAGIRSILRTTYAQGWTGTATTLLAATTAATTQAECYPTHPDANRNFWTFAPKPSLAELQMYYSQGASDWTSLTQSNVICTMNWGAWAANTEVTTNMYGTATTIHTAYTCFNVGSNKVLVTRTNNDSVYTNATPQYNRWWVFDVSTPNTAILLNTGTFAGFPNITTKMQKAPDGRYYAFCSGVGLQFYTMNTTTNLFAESTLIPIANATSYTFDSYGRLWYQLNDYSMYYTDNTTSYDVTLTLDSGAQQYAGSNLSNNLNVSAWTYAAVRVITNVDLFISGNAQFTSNSAKSIQITTSDSADIVIPITVTGPGQISFTAKPVL